MIVLQRSVPFKLLALESLLRRLNSNDPKFDYFENAYTNIKIGFEGECQVDREWDELIILKDYLLFHNYETVNEVGRSHQIDTIFLSKHFIWLIEIKNFIGILYFDEERNQFIRRNIDGQINGYSNPVDQIQRHARFMKRILRNWGFNIPVETAVIIVKDSTIIENVPKAVPVFHLSGLHSKLDKLFHKYPNEFVTDSQFNELKKRLMDKLKRKIWRPNIEKSNIVKGALCKTCNHKIVMEFIHGTFVCPCCKKSDKEACLQGLYDFKYLYSDWVSNSELREFLQIESIYSVNRLLKKFNFERKGANKNRVYKIPHEIVNVSTVNFTRK